MLAVLFDFRIYLFSRISLGVVVFLPLHLSEWIYWLCANQVSKLMLKALADLSFGLFSLDFGKKLLAQDWNVKSLFFFLLILLGLLSVWVIGFAIPVTLGFERDDVGAPG